MRKTLLNMSATQTSTPSANHGTWLDLDAVASVEVSSEDPLFPIDHALGTDAAAGWRAAAVGPQIIRLNFDEPLAIERIHLHFVDHAAERSQEFALYAKTANAELREIVRQQFTFSPGGSTEETEDYTVNLSGVTSLELRIDPDRAHDPTHSKHFAVLQSLRLA